MKSIKILEHKKKTNIKSKFWYLEIYLRYNERNYYNNIATEVIKTERSFFMLLSIYYKKLIA